MFKKKEKLLNLFGECNFFDVGNENKQFNGLIDSRRVTKFENKRPLPH